MGNCTRKGKRVLLWFCQSLKLPLKAPRLQFRASAILARLARKKEEERKKETERAQHQEGEAECFVVLSVPEPCWSERSLVKMHLKVSRFASPGSTVAREIRRASQEGSLWISAILLISFLGSSAKIIEVQALRGNEEIENIVSALQYRVHTPF